MLAFTRADTALRRRSSGSLPDVPGPPAEPEGLGQLVDERVPLDGEALGAAGVAVALGLVEVVLEVDEPLPVLLHGLLVEHGLRGRPSRTGRSSPPARARGPRGRSARAAGRGRRCPWRASRAPWSPSQVQAHVSPVAASSDAGVRGGRGGGQRCRAKRLGLRHQRGQARRRRRSRERARRGLGRARRPRARRPGRAPGRRPARSAPRAARRRPATVRSAMVTCCRVASASPATPAANARKRSTAAVAVRADALDGPGAGRAARAASRFIAHHSASPAARRAGDGLHQPAHPLAVAGQRARWRGDRTWPSAAEVRSASPMWPSMYAVTSPK